MLKKKNSGGNIRKKERKLYMITLAMMKKNRLEKMIKKKDGQTFTNFKWKKQYL